LWVGMSKETAHQLGTPISSLLGWLEYLGEKNIEPSILMAMKEDLLRLKKITHRFSKIGSKPELQMTDINELIKRFVNYIRHRISHNIQLHVELPEKNIQLPLSEELMEWVLENLVKNAVDAMGRERQYLSENGSFARIRKNHHKG
jgi:Signal transduction histidine kinase